MKKQHAIWYYLLSISGALVILFYSCSKKTDDSRSAATEGLAAISTEVITSITETTATGGGTVTSPGSSSVTERGVCWSTHINPTISDSHTTDSSGLGKFESKISGLTMNTPYFVRAYATNNTGTAYGEEVGFTTLQATLHVPVVTTGAVINIAQLTASCRGTVVSPGSSPVTARGICWNTAPNPTLSNGYSSDSGGTGEFFRNLTGLNAETLYYVRAYASNSAGDAYGNQVTFTTTSFVIGQHWGGGIIFYIDSTRTHGLISSPGYPGTTEKWGCWPVSMPGISTAIGSGRANTESIVRNCNVGYTAAKACDDFSLDNYTDWFLPSRDELNQMYIQRDAIGGFSARYYWSSSQYDKYTGYMQDFGTGSQVTQSKEFQYNLRPIRAF
jgi:hypothetical protein